MIKIITYRNKAAILTENQSIEDDSFISLSITCFLFDFLEAALAFLDQYTLEDDFLGLPGFISKTP